MVSKGLRPSVHWGTHLGAQTTRATLQNGEAREKTREWQTLVDSHGAGPAMVGTGDCSGGWTDGLAVGAVGETR